MSFTCVVRLIFLSAHDKGTPHRIDSKTGAIYFLLEKEKERSIIDIDIDFIKYSLGDNSIRNFIDRISNLNDDITIDIVGRIKPLHQQDYDGKRVNITITDANGYIINTKLDIAAITWAVVV